MIIANVTKSIFDISIREINFYNFGCYDREIERKSGREINVKLRTEILDKVII